MKKQLAILLLGAICFLLIPGKSFAARSIEIISSKSSLGPDEELIITASSSGFTNGEKIYLKGAFFKDGSTNYFGLTKINDSWIKNSVSAISQKEVIIGSWDGNALVKPDFSDTGFVGAGSYKFKVGFYYLTSGGSTSSINWSLNEINININFSPTETPAPTKTKSSLASSSNSVKSPSPSIQAVVTISKNVSTLNSSKTKAEFAKITQTQRTASEFAKIKPITKTENKKKVRVLGAKEANYAPVLFLSGVVFLVAGLSSFVLKIIKEKEIL